MGLAFFDDYSKLHPETAAAPAASSAPASNAAQSPEAAPPDPSTASFDDIKAYIDATMESTLKTIKEEMSKFQPAAQSAQSAAVDINTSQANNNSNEGGE